MPDKLLVRICKAKGIAFRHDDNDDELMSRIIHTANADHSNVFKSKATTHKNTPHVPKDQRKTEKKPKMPLAKKKVPLAEKVDPKGKVQREKKIEPLQKIKGGGVRLNAAYYFHVTCKGKIKSCQPQMIQEPNGLIRLKKLVITKHAHGESPRWVIHK